jgi:hypothetical protein
MSRHEAHRPDLVTVPAAGRARLATALTGSADQAVPGSRTTRKRAAPVIIRS